MRSHSSFPFLDVRLNLIGHIILLAYISPTKL